MSEPTIDVRDLLGPGGAFPVPLWPQIQERIERVYDLSDRRAAWIVATRQWLDAVGAVFGSAFTHYESPDVHLLMPAAEEVPERLLRFLAYCRRSLLDLFPEVARFSEPGKLVTLLLPHYQDYYAYISAFFPEDGTFGGSAGVHIRQGYPHVVVCGTQIGTIEPTLAHELTHAALQHLDAPAWLEEGITQLVAQAAAGRVGMEITAEVARRHKRQWTVRGLGPFWWGTGYHAVGGLQACSYELSEILLRLLIDEHRPAWLGIGKGKRARLIGFLKNAKSGDAGQAAAREHLGYSLGSIAAKFLGPGDWEPNPSERPTGLETVDPN